MKKASLWFSDSDREQIDQAIAKAEKQTSGEIVVVVASASGDYDRAEDLVGIWTASIGLLAQWWLMTPPLETGQWKPMVAVVSFYELLLMMGMLVVGFLLGTFVASRVGWLRRWFVPRVQMMRCVKERAEATFVRQGVSDTKERTGLLIYISLFERMVRVSGDVAISKHISQKDYAQIRDLILNRLKKGEMQEGIIKGIERCGLILGKYFPKKPNDHNELPNRLQLID